MERFVNQNGPENIVPPEDGFRSLLARVEERCDTLSARVALGIGALLVAQVGAIDVLSSHHEHVTQHALATPISLSAEVATSTKSRLITPKLTQAHSLAKPKQQPAQHVPVLPNAVPWPDAATNNLAPYIALIPSLDQAAQRFPSSFPRVQEEKTFIHNLADQVQVTSKGFREFAPDVSRRDAFQSFPFSQVKIYHPQSYVFHWTGERYMHGVDQLVHGMLSRHITGPHGEIIPDRVSVYNFTSHDGRVVYQLLPSDHNQAAHALGLNPFSEGNEMEAGVAAGRPASEVMFDITPEEVDSAIYAAVKFCIENNLPVNETSLVSHYEVDLLYNNDKYIPSLGALAAGATLNKFDLPKEFMTEVVLPKAKQLHAELARK